MATAARASELATTRYLATRGAAAGRVRALDPAGTGSSAGWTALSGDSDSDCEKVHGDSSVSASVLRAVAFTPAAGAAGAACSPTPSARAAVWINGPSMMRSREA